MAWETVECERCGKSYRVQMYGKIRDREWRKNNWNGICDECKEKSKQEAIQKAVTWAKERGLPELEGTEKQVAWAETIRKKWIETLERLPLTENEEKALLFLQGQTKARFWIDSRFEDSKSMLKWASNNMPTEKTITEKEIEKEASEEATIRPQDTKTETVAEIRILKETVQVEFPEKREDFRKIIKSNGYRWSGSCWERKIDCWSGPIEDRAAEIGHKLLAAGFCVRIFDEDLKNMAINGSYRDEQTRWITKRISGEYTGWFAIRWHRYRENFYREAKRIAGSRWSSPNVVVPPEHFEEVLDFAEMYGFELSDGAKELVTQARAKKEAALVVNVDPPKKKEKTNKNIPNLEVPESVEIADEFKDKTT